ncbi:multidrug ABC transporter ATP-binding protein [Sulfuricaulis limicola]|uniref:Multidrug ABC transporter ATP-binding protein n=1 Tax=Sulfuricaulis limicola TaxID=1620215 RepID=A0A1B4XHX4_9GAMM|nr:ABC transporter ATP-binding protein [Sulfuricaulis limicola]BAV34400.1 multidrug ABC transporter ATP-binding protein [Sulfuricaulis limicola]
MNAAAPAIVVRDLDRRFGEVRAIEGVGFEVAPGELFGVVGPDGAGKTTLLRMLAGVLKPDAGDARLHGVSVVNDPETVKHEIAYMPQRFGLYTDLTVMENLEFYADLYGVPAAERRKRRERLFQFSNLGPFKDRLAGALSGGMRQKLALSCALIHMPKILLLDEPTFGVDPISRRDLWLIVHEMVEEGVTAVVSTAYLDEAERFDRVALLHRGRLLALDAPARLQATLAGEMLVVEVESARAARELLAGLPSVRKATLFGDKLHVLTDSASAAAPEIERVLRDAGLVVHGIRRAEASLEDVFIERMTEDA